MKRIIIIEILDSDSAEMISMIVRNEIDVYRVKIKEYDEVEE